MYSIALGVLQAFAAGPVRIKLDPGGPAGRDAGLLIVHILFFLVVIRSIVQVTFSQFLPLYLKLQHGYSLQTQD
jgi:hypothetical protein